MLGVVGVECSLALCPNLGCGAEEHGCWGVSAEAAVVVFGGIQVQEIAGPSAGVFDVVEPVWATGIVFDGLE